MNKKICFVAPSGYGKTTAIGILQKSFELINIKLALPLYKLQKHFYNFINTPLHGEQGGELLQFFGIKIRKENPNFILDAFDRQLQRYSDFEGIISNDDCRPPDYQHLKNTGFIFIKINGFCRNRIDHTKADKSLSIEWQNQIPCDYEVDNWGTMEEYEKNLGILIKKIYKESEEK